VLSILVINHAIDYFKNLLKGSKTVEKN